jgi:hypothetical protein
VLQEYKMLIVTTILNKENAMILISKEAVFEIIALIYILVASAKAPLIIDM